MKKFFNCLLAISLLILFVKPALSQTEWVYPVKPGSPEWKKFNSHEEMVAACQIPDDILEKMSTKQLVQTWIDFPLRFDIFAFNTMQIGFDNQVKICNGLRELLKRDDAGKEVFVAYKKLDPLNIEDEWSNIQKSMYRFNINHIEFLLSQQLVLKKLTENEKKEIIRLALGNLEKKDRLYNSSSYQQRTEILLIGRTFENLNVDDLNNLMNQNKNLKNALLSGSFYNISMDIINEIILIASDYIK